MSFWIQKDNIYAVPALHYNMESAQCIRRAFEKIRPDCVAVEIPESFQNCALQAAARLPDISVLSVEEGKLFYLAEPCEGLFEALRSALEVSCDAYCIDLDVENYPQYKDPLPDPYSITHIGLESYFNAFQNFFKLQKKDPLDNERELFMAKRLKTLSFSYDRILFIAGFSHIQSVLDHLELPSFPDSFEEEKRAVKLFTLTEESCRDVLGEFGWISSAYEEWRSSHSEGFLDRQKLIFSLLKESARKYSESTGLDFPSYNMRNLMKFLRNYAHLHGRLMPDLFELLSSARACVDPNFAYETWLLATRTPFLKNIDNLPKLNLSVEELWGASKILKFHLKRKNTKSLSFRKRKKDQKDIKFLPPSTFSICSFPPEDVVIEKFGEKLKKQGNLLLSEQNTRTLPFVSSFEDGLDTKETIRNWHKGALYVKSFGRPSEAPSSLVVIFSEDFEENSKEKFSWKTTWIGEHSQESDMAFYATHPISNVVGPGISRCEYGGFMMTSPPRRLYDIWSDPDYEDCFSKAEVLLRAAIDYAVKPVIVYVASKPPKLKLKNYAARFGKKVIYIPRGGLSHSQLGKIRFFHVLDGHDKREIAGDYIF